MQKLHYSGFDLCRDTIVAKKKVIFLSRKSSEHLIVKNHLADDLLIVKDRQKVHKRTMLKMIHSNPRTAKLFSLVDQPKKTGCSQSDHRDFPIGCL